MNRPNFLVFLIVLIISAIASLGRADTVLLLDTPKDKLEKSAAMKSKVPVWECQRKKSGPRANPINVPNSMPTWHSKVGESQDAAGEALADGKTITICKTKKFDVSSGRMKSEAL